MPPATTAAFKDQTHCPHCKGVPALRTFPAPSSLQVMGCSKAGAWNFKASRLRASRTGRKHTTHEPCWAQLCSPASPGPCFTTEVVALYTLLSWAGPVWCFKGKAGRRMPWNPAWRWACGTLGSAELETWTWSAAQQQRAEGKAGNWLSVLTPHKSHGAVRRSSKWATGRNYLGLALSGSWEMVQRAPELWINQHSSWREKPLAGVYGTVTGL